MTHILFLDLKEFFLKKTNRSSITGFINYDQGKYKQSIVEWLEGFSSLEDAKKSFIKKFTATYEETCPRLPKKFCNNADLSLLFVEAQLNKRAMIEGTKTLNRATRTASRKAKYTLSKRSEPSSAGVSEPSSPRRSETRSTNRPSTFDLFEEYIKDCKKMSQKRGFDLETEIHKLL